jgi:hypothetical protein
MVMMEGTNSLKANGARTSDWLGQVKGGILYAYDLYTVVSENNSTTLTSEAWLYGNPEALVKVRRGLKDATEGRIKKVDLKKL